LAAAVAIAIVVDVAVNTEIDRSGNAISVSIPPPSTFKTGLPLPFAVGLNVTGEFGPVDIPGTGLTVGVPKSISCEATADPNFVPGSGSNAPPET
jgi:hypothetical protein